MPSAVVCGASGDGVFLAARQLANGRSTTAADLYRTDGSAQTQGFGVLKTEPPPIGAQRHASKENVEGRILFTDSRIQAVSGSNQPRSDLSAASGDQDHESSARGRLHGCCDVGTLRPRPQQR